MLCVLFVVCLSSLDIFGHVRGCADDSMAAASYCKHVEGAGQSCLFKLVNDASSSGLGVWKSYTHDLTKFSWKTSDARTFVHPEHTVAEGRAAESRVAERSSILLCPALQQVAAALASTSQSH